MQRNSAATSIGLAECVLAAGDDAWTFRFKPYPWAAGLEGDVSTLPGAPVAPIDLSFSEVLDNLDFGAFAVGVARKGDLAFDADAQAVLTMQDIGAAGPVAPGDLESDTYFLTLAAGRTVWRGDGAFVEVTAGARVWLIDTALRADLTPGGSRGVSESETFVDPVAGLVGETALGGRWDLADGASLGGFGLGSDISYGAIATLRYAAGERCGLTAAYRYLAVDYEDDGFVYDVAQQGVLLGAYFDS